MTHGGWRVRELVVRGNNLRLQAADASGEKSLLDLLSADVEWYPDWEEDYRHPELGNYLRDDNAKFRRSANKARVVYSLGLLCLLAGLTILAVPPESACTAALRWAAVWVGSAATVVESIWVARAFLSAP